MNLPNVKNGGTQELTVAQPGKNPRKTATRAGSRTALQTFDPRKEVFFELDAGSAREVLLAGDFTDWEKTPIKLRRGENGAWYAMVMLAPGQYHYRFVVDGQWRDDPCAADSTPNPFGTCDSVVEIS